MDDTTWFASTVAKSAATIDGTQLVRVVDDPSGTPTSKKLTLTAIKAWLLGLANTWTATQTVTPAANTSAIVSSGHSLTGSNAQSLVDLSGTWNTTGTPTAIKINITDTASNASSLLLDLLVGASSKFQIDKAGIARVGNGTSSAPSMSFTGNSAIGFYRDANGDINAIGGQTARSAIFGGQSGSSFAGLFFGAAGNISAARGIGYNTDSSFVYIGDRVGSTLSSLTLDSLRLGAGGTAIGDTIIARDAAHVTAQRNGTNAQTSRICGTYTDASNYRRVALAMTTAGVATLLPEGAGTGASGNVLHISGFPTSNPGPGILWNNAGTPAIGT